MQELEKILEEIKGLIEKHKNKAYELVAREPLTQCYTETDIEQIKVHELAVVRDIIRKHMTDGWIPVEERLPEESLNSVIGWDEERKRCCFVQRWGGRWIFGNDIDSVKITAWRPLPEPYRPERSRN
nr:MAG TPA: Protein of unknown function (DUF551) [Caudoviricetes sp.]